ncbi:MAG: gliding motility-associated C-terminal domain-containing protein [Salinivirgaceae bacterium]
MKKTGNLHNQKHHSTYDTLCNGLIGGSQLVPKSAGINSNTKGNIFAGRVVFAPAQVKDFMGLRKLLLWLIVVFFTLNIQAQSTLTSRDNYSGSWTDPASWDPVWPEPLTDTIDANINLYGNIVCNGPLSFSTSTAQRNFNVYDTLVVYGNFLLRNKDSLIIHPNAFLIVWGALTAENIAVIKLHTDARIAITGDYNKLGSVNNGSFISENMPSNVFIGGEIETGLNPSNYPVLVCSDPVSYDSSGCSYGNLADLENEAFFSDFVTACDANSASFTLSETSGLQANDGILCAGESAQLSSSYAETYLWSTGETTQSIDVSAAGDYSLTVTFSGGCQSAVSPTTIEVNPLPDATISLTDNSGITADDGILCLGDTATLLAGGGISYLWNNGETNEQILADTAGTYSVTVTNANGCSSSLSKSIVINPLPVATIAITDNYGTTNNDGVLCLGDTATLLAEGGISYLWNTMESTAQIQADTAGTYSVTVTNANGCSSIASQNIVVNPLPAATITLTDQSGTTNDNGVLCTGDTATLLAGGGISYLWNTGENVEEIQADTAGNYSVTVSDANGCSSNLSKNIVVNSLPLATITLSDNSGIAADDGILCLGDTATLLAGGGISYLWNNGETNEQILVDTAGNYVVTVTDANGCSSNLSKSIVVNSLPVATISISDNSGATNDDGILCLGDTATLLAGGGISYLWNTAENTAEIQADTAGTYSVTVTNANGCSSSLSKSIVVNPLPVVTITITDQSGSTNNDGVLCLGDTATLLAGGGISYLWNTGENTAEIQVDTAGTYSVTVTNANGCSSSLSKNIVVNPLPVATITISDNSGTTNDDGILCLGDTATLLAGGGINYLWNTGENTAEIKADTAGNYSVSVTNANGCSSSLSKSIVVNPLPVATITISDNSGTTNNDGILCLGDTATLLAGGGVSYLWNTGESTAEIQVDTAGTYSVTVTNANGCSSSLSKNIVVNPLPVATIAISDNSGITNDDGILCLGDTATLLAGGGTSYLWNTGESTAEIQADTAGNYSVTITNANGCSSSLSKSIVVNPLPVATITISDNSGTTNNDGVLCLGDTATLLATGGISYLWNTAESTPEIQVDTAGTYSVTVTNANGCSSSLSKNIVVNPLPVATITISDNSGTTNDDGILCLGDTATLLATGGTSYLWNTGKNTAEIQVDTAGTYCVTISNANGCSSNLSKSIVVNSLPVATITISDNSGITNDDGILCLGDTATLLAGGGISYLWNTAENTAEIQADTAGTYSVTVTNANGCSSSLSKSIVVNPLPVVTITISDNSGTTNNDGVLCLGDTATLLAGGGTNYLWNTGENVPEIQADTAGNYSVTVTDANGCGSSLSKSIVVNPLPVATITITDNSGTTNDDGILCLGDTATLLAGGGINYLWNTGENTAEIQTDTAGTYHVSVTNANGCSSSLSKELVVNPLPVATITINDNSGTTNNDRVLCLGDTATLLADGGISYLWNTAENTAEIQADTVGNYSVTITNANGCSSSVSKDIVVNPLPTVSITLSDNSGTTADDGVLCLGDTATLLAGGGISYLWNTGESTAEIQVDTAGTYSVSVTNANGCSSNLSKNIVVNPLPVATIAISDNSGTTNDDGVLCLGDTATLLAGGGINYLWNTGENTAEIQADTAGTYSVTVTNANGCSSSLSKNIVVNPLPVATIAISDNSGITNDDGVLCLGDTATLLAGGGISYLWNTEESTTEIQADTAGNYSITVTNANGCSSSLSKNIVVNPLTLATITITDQSGSTNNDGVLCLGDTATLLAGGGISYLWNTGENTAEIQVDTAGTYSVTVTNANGCSSSLSKNIVVNPLPLSSITISDNSGITNDDGILCLGDTATLLAGGGISYLWNTAENTAEIQADTAGTYSVTVSNANGCSNSASKNIVVNPLSVATITISDNSGTTNNDGVLCLGDTATLLAGGGTSYLWNTLERTAQIQADTAGNYSVTVTNANGCSSSLSKELVVNPLPVATITISDNSGITNDDGILCLGDTATLLAGGGINYLWNTRESTAEIQADTAGNYSVTITNANGCSSSVSKDIVVNPLPTVSITLSDNSGTTADDGVLCLGDTATLLAGGGISYLWNTGASTEQIQVDTAGTYNVSVTDGNGCSSSLSKNIVVNPLPVATITITDNSGTTNDDGILCLGDTATLLAGGGISYLWNTGETTEQILADTAGTYGVTVSNANGCSSSLSKSIVVNPLPIATITINDNSGTTNNDGVLCLGDTTTLLASGGINYLWNTAENTAEIQADTTGSYSVTITDANGCSSSLSKELVVNPLPVATITINDNSGTTNDDGVLCLGDTATLLADGGISYLWNTGESTAEIQADTAGNYSVTVSNANGCNSSLSKELVVNPLPVATITINDNSGTIANDGILCSGEAALLIANGGINYRWNTAEISHQIEVSTAGDYSVTVSDINACTRIAQQTIIVKESPTLNAGSDDEICGTEYELQASINSGTGRWSSTAGNKLSFSPDETSARARVNTDSYGSYTLIWSSIDSYCPASDELTLSFVEIPVAFAGADQQLNGRFETSLEAETPTIGVGSWNLVSGYGIADDWQAPQTRVSQLNKGTNLFVWEVQNDICTASDTVALMVSDLFIPQVITPNGDGKNDFFIVDDLETHAPASLLVFNRWGNQVYSSSDYQNNWGGISDKGDKLASDTYFYALQYANGKVFKGFIVIKR